ncbi:hypothetical protein [Nocardia amamiensis]|uniref:hypothetical protein n=1 Tax=Nocardia amamiensis TaxID=404578 RepID=UPI0008358A39|nr:hypothetical protein [Nocardia amamiensis]
MTDEMPPLYVPDVYSTQWPQQLKLSRKIHDWLEIDAGDDKKSLKTTIELTWDAFGKGVKESFPETGSVPQVDMTNPKVRSSISNMFTSYVTVNDSLKRAFDALQQQDIKVKDKVEKSKISSETARGYVNKLISALNTAAETPPPADDMSESEHVMTYVTLGMEESLKIMTDAKSEQDQHGNGVKDDAAATKALEERIKALEAASKNPASYPPYVTPPGSTPPNIADPPYVDTGDLPPGLDDLDNGSGVDDLTPGGLDDSGINGQSPGGLGDLGNTPGATTPVTPAVQPPPAMSPVGSGMDTLGPIMRMMQEQEMMRRMADQDLNSRRRDLDPERFEDELAAVAPAPVAPASVTAQPGTVQQSTTTPATHHGQPAGTTSSTQPAGAPARTPDADGSVMYTHPDGVTEKLHVTAAQAFDKAYGNHSDTDAQKAYEGTPAWWKDEEALRLLRVMPEDKDRFTSGCVVMFKGGKTALLRVDPDKVDVFHVVIKGELKPFDQNMPELASEESSFDGFRRPNGIDVTAPADKGAPLSESGSADQSANAAMPVVAAG